MAESVFSARCGTLHGDWRWMVGAAMLLALVGCEPGQSAPAEGPPVPAEEQELVVGAGQDDFVLELNRYRLGMYPINASICETLVRLTPDFRVEPWLATRWEYRGDNTYRFTLRQGVTFHDGRPFDAEAVRYSLNRAARTGIGHSFLSDESVRIVDDTTVDIRPARPNLRLVEQLVHPSYSMVAPGSEPSEEPVCTGPFRFEEYVQNSHLAVSRNDAYWGERARLERLTFRFIPDDNTRVLALRSGEVDVVLDVHRSMVASLEATPGIRIVPAPPGGVIVMYIAVRGKPPYTRMAEREVRRAVALAIDRKTLVERILDGQAALVKTINPPVVLGPYLDEVVGIPYDPAEAERLLDQAGWSMGPGGVRARNGQRLSLVMIVQPGSIDASVAQFIQAKLAEVGIEVRIEQLDPGAFSSRVNSGTFDMDLELPNQNDANPAFLLGLRWYSQSDVPSSAFTAAGPDFDALVEQALGASDPEEVRRKAAAAMHLLVDRDVIAIPLAGVHRIYGIKTRVQGFEPHPSKTNQGWNTVWIAR